MNHLISVRTNIIYAKKKKKDENEQDEYKRFQELIFLVDKPNYRYSTEGEIVRERGVEEVRFTVSERAYDELIKLLVKKQSIDESDLA